MSKYKLNVFPLFMKNPKRNEVGCERSILFFSRYFKKQFGSLFHQVRYGHVPTTYSYQDKDIKKLTHDFDQLLPNLTIFDEQKVGAFFIRAPTRLNYYALKAYEYLNYLYFKKNIHVHTITTAITPEDSYISCNSTLTLHRVINLNLCLFTNDYRIQYTAWLLEREAGTYLSKLNLVDLVVQSGVPLEKTWSCIRNAKHQCGECLSCKSRKATFRAINQEDKTAYSNA